MSTQKHYRQKLVGYTLIAIVILGAALLAAESAFANVRTDDQGGELPYYARIFGTEVMTDGDWVVIVFYRPPDCIPDDFNLVNFFDPAAINCQPATKDGFSIWKNGPPPIDVFPLLVELHGRGAVPVWFVRLAELQGALADDVVTIPELAGMASLVIGSADNYHETLQPGSHLNYVASGSLDGGGAFWVHASNNFASGKLKVQINLDR